MGKEQDQWNCKSMLINVTRDDTSGMMDVIMKGSGLIRSCMASDSIVGRMGKYTRESTLMIRNMDMAYTLCRMEGPMKDGG